MGVMSTGLGSGLDVESIITQLMSIEKQPLTALQKVESSINAKISSFGKIQSGLASLRDKAAAFNSSSLWGRTSTTLSDATVATVTSVSGQSGTAGSHTLQVNTLASAQTVSSSAQASASAQLSEGTLTIELGTWTGGTPATGFTAKSGSSPVTVTIGSGETALSSIRDKINAAGAGVTASIITDATGARLSVRSNATGAENAFRISVAESSDDGVAATGLSALAYDATTSSPMMRNQVAGNAQALIDGISITSASNTLDSVVHGLSIKLNKTTTGPVDMTVAADHADLKKSVDEFVTAFNGLADTIKTETKYDAATKTAGKLQADRTALSIQSKMRSLLGEAFSDAGAGSLAHLSDIGLSINTSGRLELKSSKLDNALANPDQVKTLLNGGSGTSTATTGFMKRFRLFADEIQGTNGALETRTTGLKNELKRNADRRSDIELRLDSTETRLRKQYNSLDQRMSKLSALSNSVSLMINNLYA